MKWETFKSGERIDICLLLVFITINSIVLFNSIFHDPRIGYDSVAHLKYIKALSELRLPSSQDTREFFSPPLPYIIPALVITFTDLNVFWAAKIAQFINFIMSIGLTLYLIKICKLITSQSSLKLTTLICLGMLPVYYKTFAFVRGEPYVLFFSVLTLYYIVLISIKKEYTLKNTLLLGLSLGLCLLSRQWGFLLLPPIFILFIFQWVHMPERRISLAKVFCICAVLVLIISGWFYLSLQSRYGSITAFNRAPTSHFSFNNQPQKFYFGLGQKEIVEHPIRPNFPNQFFPIMYSDIWGDYWCYFLVYGRDNRTSEFIGSQRLYRLMMKTPVPEWLETNYNSMGKYLGRVNLVSLYPSLLAFISFLAFPICLLSKKDLGCLIVNRKSIYAFILLAIFSTMLGYFWFLIKYPNLVKGDTIKATYISQTFPFAAIILGTFLCYLKKYSFLYHSILGGLVLVFLHNIFAMITKY